MQETQTTTENIMLWQNTKRNTMNRDGHNNVRFFIGPEVEHTPAFSRRTLFVAGEQPLKDILKKVAEHKTTHVFMGANHSFNLDDAVGEYWDETITGLLDRGLWVTLDYQAHEHQGVLNMLNKGIWQCRTFVPLLSVRIPHVQTSSHNLTIKIDDTDFNATNPGVWCLHHHEVTDSNRFTDWIEYATDEVIKDEEVVAAVEPVVEPVSPVAVPTEVKPVVQETEVKNDQDVGLDTTGSGVLETLLEKDVTQVDAVEAYAEGAGEIETKKAKAKK